jgi:hypothetical protein
MIVLSDYFLRVPAESDNEAPQSKSGIPLGSVGCSDDVLFSETAELIGQMNKHCANLRPVSLLEITLRVALPPHPHMTRRGLKKCDRPHSISPSGFCPIRQFLGFSRTASDVESFFCSSFYLTFT